MFYGAPIVLVGGYNAAFIASASLCIGAVLCAGLTYNVMLNYAIEVALMPNMSSVYVLNLLGQESVVPISSVNFYKKSGKRIVGVN